MIFITSASSVLVVAALSFLLGASNVLAKPNFADFEDESKCGADVIFVLDSSSSIWPPDFEHQLKFVRDVVDAIFLSSGATRIAVITYSDHVDLQFGLDVYRSASDIKRALSTDYVKQAKGTTNTAKALQMAHSVMESTSRTTTRRMVVVITDGQSNEPAVTKEEAIALKASGVSVFAIGVGQKVDFEELRAIGSQPSSTYVLTTPDHKALASLEHFLDVHQCEPPALTAPPQKVCGARDADLVFVLDASSSIWPPDFDKQIAFVQDVVRSLFAFGGAMRVGLLSYSDEATTRWSLGTYGGDEEAIVRAAGRLTQTKGRTNTAEALRSALGHFSSARRGVAKIAVVVTDGQSMEPEHTVDAARTLKDSGVKVFAIGVGKSVDDKELTAIASQPTSTFKYHVSDYATLHYITNFLANCSDVEPLPNELRTSSGGCSQDSPAHIVFALPTNARPEDTNSALEFYRRTGEVLDVGRDKVQVSIVSAGCPLQSTYYKSDMFQSPADVTHKIRPVTVADTTTIIRKVKDELNAPSSSQVKSASAVKGSRGRLHSPSSSSSLVNAAKFGVLIIDQTASVSQAAKVEAQNLRSKMGVTLFVVIVGDNRVQHSNAAELASRPSEHHVLTVANYDELEQWSDDLARRINQSCADLRRLRL